VSEDPVAVFLVLVEIFSTFSFSVSIFTVSSTIGFSCFDTISIGISFSIASALVSTFSSTLLLCFSTITSLTSIISLLIS